MDGRARIAPPLPPPARLDSQTWSMASGREPEETTYRVCYSRAWSGDIKTCSPVALDLRASKSVRGDLQMNCVTDRQFYSPHATDRRPKVLLITPYSPQRIFRHAADDISLALVDALAEICDLHVYAPGQSRRETVGDTTYHEGTKYAPKLRRILGIYPSGSRKEWSSKNSREVRKLIRHISPDYVHLEYMQGAEAMWNNRHGTSWTVTLHDISTKVYRQRAVSASGLQKLYRWLEFLRVARTERKILVKARHIFTLSDRDTSWVIKRKSRVTTLPLGLEAGAEQWRPRPSDHPVIVFAGAMWRDVNSAVAEYIIERVMPIVWLEYPSSVLRIVGARPSEKLIGRTILGKLEIVGEVESFDEEYLNSAVVLAPSMVDAGVLLKALRALACGCPLVTNFRVAEPIGLQNGINAYVEDTAEGMAEAILQIIRNPDLASIVASAGRDYALERFSWKQYAALLLQEILVP